MKSFRKVLQFVFEPVEHISFDEFPEFGLAEELAKQRAIECQRLRLALGERRVLLVEISRDVSEHERAGKRRRGCRFDVVDEHGPRTDVSQQGLQRPEVEDVPERLPVGLDHDREVRVLADRCEQGLRLQSLCPEG